LSRLIDYDRENGVVRYWYEDHRAGRQEVEMSREQFIGRMVQHILPKGFKRVRYYGLQATCKVKKVANLLKRAVKQVVQGVLDFISEVPVSAVVKLSYRERMKRAYGQDPLICARCGVEMWLWQVWHPDYGLIYDEGEAIKAGRYDDVAAVAQDEAQQQPQQEVQLSLFTVPPSFVYA